MANANPPRPPGQGSSAGPHVAQPRMNLGRPGQGEPRASVVKFGHKDAGTNGRTGFPKISNS